MATATKKKAVKKANTNTKIKTRYILVLDRSSSMSSSAGMAVEGYNEHVDEWKEQQKNNPDQDIDVCLITFNGQVFEHMWGVKPDKLEKASLESFSPAGSTALYDAMGYAIEKCQREDDGKMAFWMVVITDGDENASQHYGNRHDPSVIRELLDGCEKSDRWTVSFLGSSKDNLLKMQQVTGGAIKAGQMAAWSNSAGGTKRMLAQNRVAMKKYASARGQGATKLDALYSNDAAVSADYTDFAEDACLQDAQLGIADQVAQLCSTSNGPGGSSAMRGGAWSNTAYPNLSNNYVPQNVGTADVFGTSGKCVVDQSYQRSSTNA